MFPIMKDSESIAAQVIGYMLKILKSKQDITKFHVMNLLPLGMETMISLLP